MSAWTKTVAYRKTIRSSDSVRPSGNLFLGPSQRQGLVFDVQADGFTKRSTARAGRRLNVIVAHRNYGWPVITYGMDYSGAYVLVYAAFGLSKALIY